MAVSNARASARHSSSVPFPEILWLISTFAAFAGLNWFNACIASCATFWLYCRVREVVNTPTDKLIKRLGLELPSAPDVSLLEIADTSISIHWKPPENRNSILKYFVKLNGECVGDVGPAETAITIGGLETTSLYSIIVIAVNSSNFRASSLPINVRTRSPKQSANATSGAKEEVSIDPKLASVDASSISITPCKSFLDLQAAANGSTPPMLREHSSQHHISGRRSTGQRKASTTSPTSDNAGRGQNASTNEPSSRQEEENASVIPGLTASLDALRREITELNAGDEEDTRDFTRDKAQLEEKLENLRGRLKGREAESKDLKKKVTQLERELATAQAKAKAQEKLLASKIAEREKMQEDEKRWSAEIKRWQASGDELKVSTEEVEKQATEKVNALKQEYEQDQESLQKVDQQVRELRISLRNIEDQKTALAAQLNDSDPSSAANPLHDEHDSDWQRRMMGLSARHGQAQEAFQHAHIAYQAVAQRYNMLQARRGSQPTTFHAQQQQQQQHQYPAAESSNHASPESAPALSAYPPKANAPAPFGGLVPSNVGRSSPGALANTSPSDPLTSQRSSSPWFFTNNNSNQTSNIAANRPQISTDTDFDRRPSALDVERYTGGALMSPGATGLLPTGLLGDDSMDDHRTVRPSFYSARNTPPHPLRSHPFNSDNIASFVPAPEQNRDSLPDETLLPGLGEVRGMTGSSSFNAQNVSPIQQNSPSPSLMSSPHSSIANLHHQKLSETSMDSDRRSIRSVSSNRAPGPSKRFGGFFGGRTRGKTTVDDGPALGSLSSKHTQSLPRSDSDPVDTDLQSKRIGHNHGLLGHVSGSLLGRRQHALQSQQSELDRTSIGEMPTDSFNFFGPRNSIWAQRGGLESGSLSRPASTYSVDPITLQKQIGSESILGWSNDNLNRVNGNGSRAPWSLQQSRRHSLQGDALSNVGDEEDDEVEDDLTARNGSFAAQAPIGTKPAKLKTKPDRPLNPAADSFMSKLLSDKKSDSKTKRRGKDSISHADAPLTPSSEDAPLRRLKSKGDRANSITDSAESSSVRDFDEQDTPVPEDVPTPSSATRESFMSKLTRKSSSNRFSMGSLRLTRKQTATSHVADETDEDSSALGRSVDSIGDMSHGMHHENGSLRDAKRSSAFSLSSLRRKKKGTDAPSISETSMTSASANGDDLASGRPSVDEQIQT